MFFVLFLVGFVFLLYFALQTYTFQTWAAKKATNYLSSELHAKVEIGKLEIQFLKTVVLKDVFVEDKHGDTLIYGKEIFLNLSSFNFSEHHVAIKETKLDGIKVKLLKYVGEEDFNFQYLVDYFSSNDSSPKDTTVSNWKLDYGFLTLKNVDFTYHLMRDTNKVTRFMNYNNIHVKNVNGVFSAINIKHDTIEAQINNLSAIEQCGFKLKRLNAKVKIASTELKCDNLFLKTEQSLLLGKLHFKYDAWEDYEDFVNKVYMKTEFKDSTYLNFKDITYFAEDIEGFNEQFFIKGKVRGFVNDLSGSDLNISYRNHTQFIGDFSITGLPNIDSSYIHFDAEKVSTSIADLSKFPIPPFNNPSYLQLPNELKKLGVISYKGKFDGFLNSFVTYGTISSDIGKLKTDLKVNTNLKTKIVEYLGNVKATNLDIGKLFPNINDLGKISLTANVNGKGLTLKELDTKVNGIINSISFKNYDYTNIKLNGIIKNRIFNGDLRSEDPNCDLDFLGSVDFTGKFPKMDFISTINNFDLDKTNLATSKLGGHFSSQVLINLNGDDIDNLSGTINFDNTFYHHPSKTYKINTFDLILEQESVNKLLKLNSDIVSLQMTGKYKLSNLQDAFFQYLNSYYPTFFKAKTNYIYNDKADLVVRIKKFQIIQELFINELEISNNTILNASFDAGISFLNVSTLNDYIKYSGIVFRKNNVQINSLTKGISFTYLANNLNVSDSLGFVNPKISLLSNDKTTSFNIGWDNKLKPRYMADLNGKILFGSNQATVVFDNAKCIIADSLWQQIKPNPINIDTAFVVTVSPLTFYNHNQLITIEGVVSKNPNDKLDVFIQNLQLSQFNRLISDKAMISVEGLLSGNTSIYGVLSEHIIASNLTFKDLKLNNKLVGNGELNTDYNKQKNYVYIDGFSAFSRDFDGNLLKNIEFKGYYFPDKKEDNLDVTFRAEPFDVSLLQVFLKDILTIKVGYLNGYGKVTGSIAHPEITARLKFFKCVMLIDYLNAQYSVSGEVNIEPTQINFDNIEIRDKSGNLGLVDGHIFHKNFDDIRLDFDINTKKLMLLNTNASHNPTFYGTVYASGNAGIYGYTDDIKIEVNMKTNGGTYVYIPLDGPAEVGNNEFIRFITKDTIKPKVVVSNSNLSIDLNLEATSDAEVQLIFDEKSGDVIKARGDGNLNMKINTKGKFDMYGDYNLSSGDYLFTLENFVTKRFEIQQGSNIKWNGSAYKANIDITAVYRQRASVRPIYPTDSSGKRYPVECKLFMKNKLTNPDINFGIELPTIDENSRSAIKTILLDENEMNRQFFSLLLLRSFVTPLSAAGAGGISAGGAFASTGSEMLSNKISNWLNGVTKEVDIGVNYRPGTGLSSDELDLTLNKQLFNNRLVIDGNLGVANNANRSSNGSNVIGDVSIEYKLSQSGKYRIRAFNRSNDNTQVINNGGPFTQGVGVFYREEFENLNELYRRYLAKFKKNPNP